MYDKFIITGFSDEIGESSQIQFSHLNKLGIKYFEPRGINGKNVTDLSEDEAIALRKEMDSYGINVSSIGSPIGKISIDDDFEPHMEKLKHTIKIAKIFGTKYIRIFSFFIPDENYEEHREEVLRRMNLMTELAEKENIILLHENEKGIYGDNALRCFDVVSEIDSPNLRCVFDPANFVQCRQLSYPAAFNLLKPYIEYMHIKDAKEDCSVVPSGYGIGGIEDILKELQDSGWEGFLSLEPHLGDFKGLADLEADKKTPVTEPSTPEKFELAYNALKNILERIG